MNALLAQTQAALRDLCRSFGVARLEVFGSAAGGAYQPGKSDLDFLVTFHPCTPADHADRYFGLLAALENLYSSRVDLVEDKAISNPYFRRGVDSSRELLYAG